MYAKNSVWTMKTTIITDDEADHSVEVSLWEEASDGVAASEAASEVEVSVAASEVEVSVAAASEVVVPEVNSNLSIDISWC